VPVEKSVAATLADIKEELKTFFQTRAQIFRTETAEKIGVWKRSLVLLVLAAVFLVTFWGALVFSLVALVHSLFSSSGYEWLWGGLIVSGVFLVLGGLLGQAGYKRLKSCRPAPSRTLRVLGQDRVWIKDEARPA
jgi:uncharacterized membrane protein YqjE